MSQATTWSVPLTGPVTPPAYSVRIDESLDAALSSHSGSTRPAYAVAGTVWLNTATAGQHKYYAFDGVNDRLILTITTATGAIAYSDGVSNDVLSTKVDKATSVLGQCRLALSGGNLLLSRFNGQWLTINGALQSIPSAGITLAATGLTPGTLYYIYAYMNSGTMTLEASTTGHSTDSTTGVEIKSGDQTRTLVGIARPITGPVWADSATQRLIRSWFNRKPSAGRNAFTANRSTTSLTIIEINSEIRVEWLQWGDEVPIASIQGASSNNTANLPALTTIGWDGVVDLNSFHANTSATGLFYNCSTTSSKDGLSEGYHYATVMGSAPGGGTANWAAGTGIAGQYTSLNFRIG
ncbi:hypothetical protein [Rhizobium leguminosarum]|uniref:hypothetical protein n=1 Tax=Rhizobium leguminosarum TaxID=384 RepID=UPI001C90357B|nr:hypothetical protein [Rhizobium leguminosarum]MBY2906068.1 hypothetical protein [Rhizobium leguminosarum]